MINFDQVFFDRALAAYLGFAIGDALGATVEFMRPEQIKNRYGVHQDIIGGGWLDLNPGQITDDTQMSLALADAVISQQQWSIQAIADNFVRWLESKPPDIGNTTRRGIKRYQKTGEIFGLPRPDDAGNGACMRNLPVALLTLSHPDNFRTWTLQQCHITHHHPLSDAATLALGYLTQRLIQGQPLSQCQFIIDDLLVEHPEFIFKPYPGKASAYIVETLQTVLHYFYSSNSFESCLINTVNQGDDADTTGALAGMLAGAYYGLEQIPQRWLSALEPTISKQIHEQVAALLKLGSTLSTTT